MSATRESHQRPRIRSLLFAPGNQARKLERVFEFGSDAVDLDLEDAVPPAEKVAARSMVRDTIARRAGQPGPAIVVRVNPPDTDLMPGDLEAVVQPGVFALHITKVGSAERVREMDRLVSALEEKRGIPPGTIQFISSCDSAHLVLTLPELARSSPRLYCLIIGGADFAMNLGLRASEDMVESLWARSYGVLVSRDAGLAPPLHPPHFALSDDEGNRRLLTTGKRLGFQGAITLHPRQVAIANEIFAVSDEEVRQAEEIIARCGAAEAAGKGAIQLEDGTFLDVAMVKWAEEIMRRREAELAARRRASAT